MRVLIQFVIGVIFGLGLLVSGMSDPAKVLNFLDFGGVSAGTWDPSLAFVMAGAVAVTLIGYRLVLKRPRPLLAEQFHVPGRDDIDLRIVVGPVIFGVGWGLSGFCPGPALTALGFGAPRAFLFVAAMLAGMMLARWIAGRPARSGIVTPAG
ncbi:YeeE/YedE family protein [Bradyrhizobium lablabi]|uniref:DUF6691 family protein n=1 Tax=Bradyrhizobium lablabi TaxID=722472 RepID=UPI001BAA0918|nr:DUF6691 family protein [Bradyrhizobium lablabi]MBR1124388.1 YeeE/YedE family protein [Bradyrhizobium lablabi]